MYPEFLTKNKPPKIKVKKKKQKKTLKWTVGSPFYTIFKHFPTPFNL